MITRKETTCIPYYDLATNMYKVPCIDLAINDECECDQDLSVYKSLRVLIAQNRTGPETLKQSTLICWPQNQLLFTTQIKLVVVVV